MAKIQPIITSWKIKDGLKLWSQSEGVTSKLSKLIEANQLEAPVRHHCWKNGMCRIGSNLPWIDRPKNKWHNILWTDKIVKLFFSGLVVIDSTSHDPRVLNSSHSTLWRQWSMVVQRSWYGGCFSYYSVGPIYHILWNMDQFEYIKILEEIMLPYAEEKMPLRWVFQQDNKNKNTWVSEQHLGSRQKGNGGNGVASSIPQP